MTVLWIVIAAIVAAAIALFSYGYIFSNKKKDRKPWFALLRFCTVFSILILLINPKFKRTTYRTIKPLLAVVVDDSKSVDHLNVTDDVRNDYNAIVSNVELQDFFEIESYRVTTDFETLDSLSFKGKSSRIEKGIKQPQELYRNRNKAIVYLTDGNQTIGSSYKYEKIDAKTAVYPIIYGDTSTYPDIEITQLNVNKYSYLGNEFPVEVFVNYTGSSNISTNFKILQGNKVLQQQPLRLSKDNPSRIINLMLTSDRVGTMSMKATIETIPGEINTANNARNFAVQVIDQQSKILILSDIMHPDLGALKKAISSNQQRSVKIASTSDDIDYNQYSLIIMYGANSAFAKAYQEIEKLNKNTWLITGPAADYRFINSRIKAFQIEDDPEFDEVQPILNTAYGNFNLETYNYEDYPPVQVPFGAVTMNTLPSILMYKNIGGFETTQPLWFTYEDGESRYAVSLLSGLWRWRAQSYLDNKEFTNFDDLINSQVQFLASNKRRNRLDVDYESFYYQNNKIILSAQYLDKNYEFEDNGILNVFLTNTDTGQAIERPFILSGNSYMADLSGLPAGKYKFKVTVDNDSLSSTGIFSVLSYDVEAQSISANASGMQSLVGVENTYFNGQLEILVENLKNNPLLKPVERASTSYATLIDWEYLMGVILILLGIEWFLRKYNGLI